MRKGHRRGVGVWFAVACVVVGFSGEAGADLIKLRQGQPLKGKLIVDKAKPGQYLLIAEIGKTPMVIQKDQVVQVTPEKSVLDEYVLLIEKDRPDVQSEYEVGLWCEEHQLKDLALVHYDLAVKRDSTFGPAHKKLGHVWLNGRWLNAEEMKEAQGLVKYQGRWISPEERDRREALASKAAEGSTWSKKIKLLRDSYVSGQPRRSEDAERRLLDLDDPVTIGPILKVMGEDPIPAVRALASRVLGGIPGVDATNGLVGRFLAEDDPEVRKVTMNELSRRESAEVVPLLSRSLRSAHHQIINRSAWGLGNLNAVAVVPKLIPVLITVEQEIVIVDSGVAAGNGIGFNSGGGSPSGIGNSGRAIPYLTPPAVGPGAVAYGASSVPSTSLGGAGYSAGSGNSLGPIPKLVPVEYRNDEVLAALVKLTGQNFGYDVAAWRQWLSSSFKVEAPLTRRVREP